MSWLDHVLPECLELTEIVIFNIVGKYYSKVILNFGGHDNFLALGKQRVQCTAALSYTDVVI